MIVSHSQTRDGNLMILPTKEKENCSLERNNSSWAVLKYHTKLHSLKQDMMFSDMTYFQTMV